MTPLLSALTGDADMERLLSDEAQVAAMLAVERALAGANADAGFISPAAAEAIDAAIDGFAADFDALAHGMARDGVVVPALLAQVRGSVADPHGPALHKGATSQDIVDTALMLQLAKALELIEGRIGDLISRLGTLQAEHGDKPLTAHTRMQVALPTTWRPKLQSWSEPLSRHLKALAGMKRSLLVVQLGGPVGDRGSFEGHGEAIAAGMAKRLGLGIAAPWHAERDPIVGLGDALARVTGSLGKLGADVALLAQTEVGAVTLTGGGGSSAMPHKSNPVSAEVLVALGRYNAGLAGILQQAMIHEYERSGAAWTLEWLTLPRMLVSTAAALRLATALLDQIRIA